MNKKEHQYLELLEKITGGTNRGDGTKEIDCKAVGEITADRTKSEKMKTINKIFLIIVIVLLLCLGFIISWIKLLDSKPRAERLCEEMRIYHNTGEIK